MSEDEMLVVLFCSVVAGITLGWWLVPIVRIRPLAGRGLPRGLLLAWPPLCLAALYLVLRHAASADVRDSGVYLFFYMAMGAAWLGVGHRLLDCVDLRLRDDALERANPAAGWAVLGGQLGLTLCFAGANIGDGPGWWVVVFCGGLASVTLLLLWVLLDLLTRIGHHLTVARDTASGLRAFALLAGGGLILGRAAAGDWQGAGAATADFLRVGAPAWGLFAVGALCQGLLRPTVAFPRLPWWAAGLPPALLLLGLAATAVHLAGPW